MKKRPYRARVPFRERFFRFMSGRYGSDSLNRALLILYMILIVINLFLGSWILFILELALVIYLFFRMMSRNLYARRRENAWYCARVNRVKGFFRLRKQKRKDRKTHVFRKCPQCKNNLRLPKVKGSHTVKCPCCGNRFEIKI